MTVHERFLHFIRTREAARLEKEMVGGPGPHSSDPIIGKYRFCNVNREHDSVTMWIKRHVRDVYAKWGENILVPQILAARIFNEPNTLAAIIPVTDINTAAATLKVMRAQGKKIMRGAYMMPVHGKEGGGKTVEEYYLKAVFQAEEIAWCNCTTLDQVAQHLVAIKSIGEFIANQVCTDLRYTPQFERAPDWEEFVLCGPGSRRGIDRYDGVQDEKKRGTLKQSHYVRRILDIREEMWLDLNDEEVRQAFRDPNNLSNCFCEFDKYERILADPTASLRLYSKS